MFLSRSLKVALGKKIQHFKRVCQSGIVHNKICVSGVAEQFQSIDLGKTTPPNTAATGGTKLRARSGERRKTKQKQFTGGTGGVAAVLRSLWAKHLIKHLDTSVSV